MYLSNKNKQKTYYVYYINEKSGKYTRISTRTKIKSQALIFLSEFQTRLQEKKTAKELTVQYLSDLKAETIKYVSENMETGTLNIYKNLLNNFERVIGNKPLKLITGMDIEHYKAVRLSEVSKATVNIDIRTLKAVFNLAVRFEWLSLSPARYVKKLTIPEKEYLAFTKEETDLILNNTDNTRIKSLITFALHTGCRIGEILNCQWRDIDFKERVLTIRNKANFKTKTGKIRHIPITDKLSEMLRGMREHENNIISLSPLDEYIFTNLVGVKFNKNFVSKYFKSVLRKLGFNERYSLHSTRHTYITNLIKAGVNINYVREIAGHSNISTTMGYTHISTNDLKEAINKINL